MKTVLSIVACLWCAVSAQAIFFQWTPADTSESWGYVQFTDPAREPWASYPITSVIDFSFNYGGGLPTFTSLSRAWGLYADGNGAKLTSALGSAGFTSNADDCGLTFNLDSFNHDFGNAWAIVQRGDERMPIIGGKWLRVDNVPDAGNTLGFLALSLLGLFMRRHCE